jgi:predicted membrane protein
MRISRRERGEGNFGCLFGLIILVLAAIVAYKVIPVKVKNAELRGVINDESKSAGTHNDEKIRQYILAKAREDDLPVTTDDVKITRGNNEIHVDVEYTMPINFPGYVYQWHIEHHVSNPIF